MNNEEIKDESLKNNFSSKLLAILKKINAK
jgi:hypothetical protein